MNGFEAARERSRQFGSDDGSADPDVLVALAGIERTDSQRRLVDLLSQGRLLMPVIPEGDGTCAADGDASGCGGEACQGVCGDEEHLTAVTIADPAGRKALLCFTGSDALARWRPDARPAPVAGPRAAAVALQEECVAMLIDAAGPHRFALSGTGMWALAAGGPWLHPLEDPAVRGAIVEVLTGHGIAAGLEPVPDSIDGVAVVLDAGTDPQRAQALAESLSERVEVRTRVSALEVRWAAPDR